MIFTTARSEMPRNIGPNPATVSWCVSAMSECVDAGVPPRSVERRSRR
jgi:hypothetical protein